MGVYKLYSQALCSIFLSIAKMFRLCQRKQNLFYFLILTKSMYNVWHIYPTPLLTAVHCTFITPKIHKFHNFISYTRNIEKLYPRNGEQCSWSEWDDILWKFLIHLQIFIDFGPNLYTVPHTPYYSLLCN